MKSERNRLDHEHRDMKEKIKDNKEKIKMNRQLPYLVGNIVEVRVLTVFEARRPKSEDSRDLTRPFGCPDFGRCSRG